MKHSHITDNEMQAAVDAAIQIAETPIRLETWSGSVFWTAETPARLHLARELIERLPESPPPTADGKTPGQVAFEAWGNQSDEWHKSLCSNWQAAASAVLAAFGNQSLEAAIARMESVLPGNLADCFEDDHIFSISAIEKIKARLISAAKGEQP